MDVVHHVNHPYQVTDLPGRLELPGIGVKPVLRWTIERRTLNPTSRRLAEKDAYFTTGHPQGIATTSCLQHGASAH